MVTLTVLKELYCAWQYITLTILHNKTAKIIEKKLASVSLYYRSHRFKTANIIIFIRTDTCFYIYDRPVTYINVLLCVKFMNKSLIFAVLKRWFLQQSDIEASFVFQNNIKYR